MEKNIFCDIGADGGDGGGGDGGGGGKYIR